MKGTLRFVSVVLLLMQSLTFGEPGAAKTPTPDKRGGAEPMPGMRSPGNYNVTLRIVGADGVALPRAVVKFGGTEGLRPNADGILTIPWDRRVPQVDIEITAPGHETVKHRVFHKSPSQTFVVPLNRVEPVDSATDPTH